MERSKKILQLALKQAQENNTVAFSNNCCPKNSVIDFDEAKNNTNNDDENIIIEFIDETANPLDINKNLHERGEGENGIYVQNVDSRCYNLPDIDYNSENGEPDYDPQNNDDINIISVEHEKPDCNSQDNNIPAETEESDYNLDQSDPASNSDSEYSIENINTSSKENRDIISVVKKGRPKRGRKRKFEGQTFKTKKKLQYGNKSYYTYKGNLKTQKKFLDDLECMCKQQCHSLVDTEDRKKFFECFYKLANYDAQTSFLAASVQEVPVKRKRVNESERRSFTRIYKIRNQAVCKTLFLKTLQISSKRINTALKKFRTGRVKDERGDKQGGHNKLTDEIIQAIIGHIKKFPTYKSHYCRQNTESLYLHFDMTEQKMYELFLEENKAIKISFSSFKNIFHENFNLRRKRRIKDTCSLCDSYVAKINNLVNKEEKDAIDVLHKQHLKDAETARSAMKHDFSRSKDNQQIHTISYDMEKTLPMPNIPTSIVFYKRQLWLYNEGIHTDNSKAFCYVWKEGEAGRGSQEVGSCLRKYIHEYGKENIKELILWSDSCGGQNRNIKMVLMMKSILQEHPTLETIYLKYLVSGHSYLPNDSDFSDIESFIKLNQRIYTPEEYMKIMENCRKKNRIKVVRMEKEFFFSVKRLENQITNRKTDTEKNKISWLKSRIIKLEKNKPYSIFFRDSHNENLGTQGSSNDYKEVLIHKDQKGRRTQDFGASKLDILWPDGKEISNKKLNDLKTLMPFIPKDAKEFYKGLRGLDFEDDLDGFGEDVDFEPEGGSET